jgi:membrane protease YdiL (CAAX protease family)
LAISGWIAASLPTLGIIRCLESFLLVFIVLWIERDPGTIGLSRSKLPAGFTKGLIWSVCFGIVAGVFFLILLGFGINATELMYRSRSSFHPHLFVFFLVGGVIGPVAEEIFFRGIIFGFFRQWGAVFAVVFSTLVFVFTHPVGGNLPLTQLVGGIVFAVAYEKEKNLMVPITIHCLGNLAIFSLPIIIN